MLQRLIRTSDNTPALVLRLALGLMMLAHGSQKLFGWFGGYGWDGTMGFLTDQIGLSAPLAALLIVGEFAAGLGLIVGLLGRVAALGTLAIMLGAVFTAHLPNGFFMNWSGTQKGEGIELHILAIAMAVAVALQGSGALSIDQALTRDGRAA
jgi:putative oxidoreductase